MCTELGRRRLAAVLCTVARPVSTCWGAGEAVVPSGSWLGWLAFGRLSAGVRCPKVAMTACSSMYRLSVSASCCGTGTWLACAFDFPCVAPAISLVSGLRRLHRSGWRFEFIETRLDFVTQLWE